MCPVKFSENKKKVCIEMKKRIISMVCLVLCMAFFFSTTVFAQNDKNESANAAIWFEDYVLDESVPEPYINTSVNVKLGSSYTFIVSDNNWLNQDLHIEFPSATGTLSAIMVKIELPDGTSTSHSLTKGHGIIAHIAWDAGTWSMYAKATSGSGTATLKIYD